MAYSNFPKFGLAIDWETSGFSTPDYASQHQGISFGAIIFDVKTLDGVESLYREVKFNDSFRWEAGAERVHGISRAHLAQHGVSQEQAAEDLLNLIIKYIGTEDVLLMGHRVYFDRAFTNQLTAAVGVQLPYNPTTIDTCSIATVLMEMTKSDDVFTTLGMPPRAAHNALEDIQYTLESVKRIKQFFITGVAASLG